MADETKVDLEREKGSGKNGIILKNFSEKSVKNSISWCLSKNNYYNSTVFNRNSRLQLYIKYDIFRF